MLQVFNKVGDEIILVYHPKESVEVGENLRIVDKEASRGIVVQVIEQNLVDLPGILEDAVRRESLTKVTVVERTPSEAEKYVVDVRNMKFARAKIRKELRLLEGAEKLEPWSGWTPDRSAEITPVPDVFLMNSLGIGRDFPIPLGETSYSKMDFRISGYDLQGINVIVGKKGTGKSHLAKTILLGLISHAAKSIVFDVNDEYSGLAFQLDGKTPSEYGGKIIVLEPEMKIRTLNIPLKFTLQYIGLDVFYTVLVEAMNLPEPSAYTVRNIWENLEKTGQLSFANLSRNAEQEKDTRVREAIVRRLDAIGDAQIITDDPKEENKIEDLLGKISEGGAIVINMKAKSRVVREIVVQTIVSKIQQLLEPPESKPIFLLAEEAHMYVSESGWEDIVTRIRHLGAYQLYMTNTPTTIPDLVVRQTDNIFIFNLTNQSDFMHLLPATKTDQETVMAVGKALPPKTCMVIGQTTNDYPFIITTRPLSVTTAGKTKLLFFRN